jgi:hypothetical protein
VTVILSNFIIISGIEIVLLEPKEESECSRTIMQREHFIPHFFVTSYRNTRIIFSFALQCVNGTLNDCDVTRMVRGPTIAAFHVTFFS